MVAAKQMFLGESLSAKSYVQDGLVAMWDGIENAGWGTHDASSTTWRDLVGGGGDISFGTSGVVGSNSIQFTNFTSNIKTTPFPATIELLFNPSLDDRALLNFGNAANWSELTGKNALLIPYVYTESSSLKFQYYYKIAALIQTFEVNKCNTIVNSSGIMTLFLDGIEYSSATATGISQSYSFRIGGYVGGISGTVKYIRFYNRVLTPAEIAANYAVDKVRFNLT